MVPVTDPDRSRVVNQTDSTRIREIGKTERLFVSRAGVEEEAVLFSPTERSSAANQVLQFATLLTANTSRLVINRGSTMRHNLPPKKASEILLGIRRDVAVGDDDIVSTVIGEVAKNGNPCPTPQFSARRRFDVREGTVGKVLEKRIAFGKA